MSNLTITPADSQLQANLSAESSEEESWTPDHGMITVRLVKVKDIIADDLYQMRVNGTDPNVVAKYASIMKENDPDGWAQFPLIRVFVSTNDLPCVSEAKNNDQFREMLDAPLDQYKIVSGFHRHAAILLNGYDEIRVEMMYGDETDAIVAALGQNKDQSVPRTQEDIRKMMEFSLTHPEIRTWNNHQIARWNKVDAQTVTNHEIRLMSTPNFGFEPRPEKLKFIDKHGNISLRKHTPPTPKEKSIGDGLVIDPKGEVIEAAEPEMDAEGLEREKLMWDIEGEYNEEVREFIFHTDRAVMSQRETELIETYPIMERYPYLAKLSLEDLRGFKDQLDSITSDLNRRKVAVGQEMNTLFEKEIEWLFPDDMNYSQRSECKEAVKEAFPQLKGTLYKLSYYDRLRIKNAIPAVAEQLKQTGINAYLPESYSAEKKEEEKKADPHKELAKAVEEIRDKAEEKILEIAGIDTRYGSTPTKAVSIFRSNFNKAYPDNAEPKDKVTRTEFQMRELPLDELKEIREYWRRVNLAIRVGPRQGWVDVALNSFKCQQCAIKIAASRDYDQIGKALNLVPASPLSEAESMEIINAAHAAAKEKADEIHQQHINGTDGEDTHAI